MRLLIRLGLKGRRHKIREQRLIDYMHNQGIGA